MDQNRRRLGRDDIQKRPDFDEKLAGLMQLHQTNPAQFQLAMNELYELAQGKGDYSLREEEYYMWENDDLDTLHLAAREILRELKDPNESVAEAAREEVRELLEKYIRD